MTLPARKGKPQRAVQLKSALALRGITLKAYAAQLDVHPDYVRAVAVGRQVSPRITAEIDAFIGKHRGNA